MLSCQEARAECNTECTECRETEASEASEGRQPTKTLFALSSPDDLRVIEVQSRVQRGGASEDAPPSSARPRDFHSRMLQPLLAWSFHNFAREPAGCGSDAFSADNSLSRTLCSRPARASTHGGPRLPHEARESTTVVSSMQLLTARSALPRALRSGIEISSVLAEHRTDDSAATAPACRSRQQRAPGDPQVAAAGCNSTNRLFTSRLVFLTRDCYASHISTSPKRRVASFTVAACFTNN